MQIRIDIKSLVIGFLTAAVVFLVMGQEFSSADKSDYGLEIGNSSLALVRSNEGIIYSVDPRMARAQLVINSNGPAQGLPLNLNQNLLPTQKPAGK
jgi:hypothetical protein